MRWVTWSFLARGPDLGLLVLRVGLGLAMVAHGWPKLAGGAIKWTKLGGAMASLGVTFAPMAWGLAAAVAETLGGVLLVLGLATRPAAAALTFTMFVAFKWHYDAGEGFGGYSHALEDGIAFLALVLLGPGRYSVDHRFLGGR